ncbi:MAG TPA: lysylphosphatidylglycerol synthase domain-containing protein [Flavisolibacter sp.]
MRVNKNIKNFLNYFLGPALFAWLAFTIYRHITHQPQLETSWQMIKASFSSSKALYLVAAFLLVFVNWGIEAWKWQLSVASVHRVSFLRAFEAVLSGVSFSVTMPNRIGEYLGRMIYMPEGSRLRTIAVTIVGSFSQLLVTLIAGFAGLVVLRKELLATYPQLVIWYQFIIYGLLVIIILLLVVYYNTSRGVPLFDKWIRNRRYHYLVEALGFFHAHMLSRLLLISFLRYLVFIAQYILVFYLFEVSVGTVLSAWVMSVVFLALAVVPSITLVELGVRGQITLQLMGIFSPNALGIGLATVSIWFINLIFPAVIGSLLILNHRIFRKQEDTII